MRKDFLIMSNFYLVEILSEPNSLTITTQNEQSCAHFEYFFSHNENQQFAVQRNEITKVEFDMMRPKIPN